MRRSLNGFGEVMVCVQTFVMMVLVDKVNPSALVERGEMKRSDT